MENNELERNKFYLDKFFTLIVERDKSIIFIFQLMIALLVIAGLNNKIISTSVLPILKVLIVVLLSLIPIMVIDYLILQRNMV